MISTISREAAKRLRPAGAFHLPPARSPLGTSVDLLVENSRASAGSLHHRHAAARWAGTFTSPKPIRRDMWTAKLHTPLEPTILTYIFEFHSDDPDEKHPPLLEIRQVEGRNTAIYGEYEQMPFKIAVYDPGANAR